MIYQYGYKRGMLVAYVVDGSELSDRPFSFSWTVYFFTHGRPLWLPEDQIFNGLFTFAAPSTFGLTLIKF